ncbi:MAG: hypothetical protein PHP95_07225 [Desulfuromonadaceae bacterium]|nr:hypothetical protein [Desulfuromonadaceae bacterium]MDD4130600.1 hypothetical protein [Desulfuromonadaceae bacterium]
MFSFSFLTLRSLYAALFALLTAITLSSCANGRPSHSASLAPFTSDGCSLFPDGTSKDRDRWCDCCQAHDFAYWQGGSDDERQQADALLRACVLTRTGDNVLAETMYLGTRAGGHPAFPIWYRWGYGWPYGRGYKRLSGREKLQVQEMLSAYAQRHPAGYCVEKYKKP